MHSDIYKFQTAISENKFSHCEALAFQRREPFSVQLLQTLAWAKQCIQTKTFSSGLQQKPVGRPKRKRGIHHKKQEQVI